MQPYPRTIFALFDSKRRYVIPMFQRQYVWTEERQWEPLWKDIERKTLERFALEKTKEGDDQRAIPHFLGAIVLDLQRTYGNEIQAHSVIDGQQRLTTFQILLTAFRDVAAALGVQEYSDEINRYILNTGIMADENIEQYKLWPTNLDQPHFKVIVNAGGVDELAGQYPAINKAHMPDVPHIVQAYVYLSRCISGFMTQKELLDPDKEQPSVYTRIKTLFETLQNDLMLVSIELEGNDDPQVIFETLNARGEPLLPSDLLRNYIFWRAARNRQNVDELYENHWHKFDTKHWKKEEKQGRLSRPRIDILFQNILQIKTSGDVNIGRLFHEYKQWIEKNSPYTTVTEELSDIDRYAAAFNEMISHDPESVMLELVEALSALDVKTIFPLILYLKVDAGLSDEELRKIFIDIESYLVRRLIGGYTTKNYNNLFIQWLREIKKEKIDSGKVTREKILSLLSKGNLDTNIWPNDESFYSQWISQPVYNNIRPKGKLEFIMKRLELAQRTSKNEDITINSKLTIEHVMPREWIENWPLMNGQKGKSLLDRLVEPCPDSTRRDHIVHTIGNLTLLTHGLNSSVSNGPYSDKKDAITSQSSLALNRYFNTHDVWNEDLIEKRGTSLFEIAKSIWPHPSN